MSYKKIAVFGATGQLGREITRVLAEEGFEVVPLSRQETTVAGIQTQKPDISLAGIDAIVSTVGPAGLKDQLELIRRAKAEGVKRFIPSEFGMDHRNVDAEFFKPKVEAFEAVKAANFPDGWTATINGFFDSVLTSLVKWDLATSTAKITGKGETKYPFVLRSDIGRVLAETFRNPAEYKNRWLALANDWLSGKDIVALVEEATDKTLTVEHVEADPAKTPVIFFLEKKDGNVFDPSLQTKNLPVGLTDFKTHVKSLL
ncbi:hypothetical protein VTN31DRAFT_984 [Thermomyces dupontii]|uniref:uncharacterized protein n=1 Tax=Talaromyces thermophilus TaxID=28565 RepID=UPI003742EFC1